MDQRLNIIEVSSNRYDIETIKELFLEYARSLGFSLCFQNFQKELDELPGIYSPPEGILYLAVMSDKPAGCVALKPIDQGICEMKRLYVRPQYRGNGIGKALAMKVINKARELSYQKMRLDTIHTMKEAIALYRSFGFYEIPPYYPNPIEGALYLELSLI